jgi:ribulose-phosphate 3-epimerase
LHFDFNKLKIRNSDVYKRLKMAKMSPSILAADFNILGEQISILEKNNADYLHIDVMDGIFVPSISFGMPLIKSIRKNTKMFFDVHLMIREPIRYIKEFADCGADLINIHYEACEDVVATLNAIKNLGVKIGITIKPSTPVSVLKPLLGKVDLILVMSVEPGFGGQRFIEETYEKLSELRELTQGMVNPPEIEVDGGVTLENAEKILKAGANVLVAGSAIFKGDIEKNIKAFKQI